MKSPQKSSARKSAVSRKISELVKSEGKPQRQAVAMALSMKRAGRLTPAGGYVRAGSSQKGAKPSKRTQLPPVA